MNFYNNFLKWEAASQDLLSFKTYICQDSEFMILGATLISAGIELIFLPLATVFWI